MDLRVDGAELASCVQCGLCLSSCPTYRVTGDETMSPRGRIALMRQVHLHDAPVTSEILESFETCIQCRGCEPACPSVVPYGITYLILSRFIFVSQDNIMRSFTLFAGKKHYMTIAGTNERDVSVIVKNIDPKNKIRFERNAIKKREVIHKVIIKDG